MQGTMTRNTGAIKTVFIALIVLGWLYTMYKYHETSEKLQTSRQVGERIRKEQEKLSSKLQDTLTEAEDHRQNCDREKKEYDRRLQSQQQQHKMLQAQHQDLEAELTKIQREKEKEAEDRQSADLQRTQEYERLKQEKELEISNLKDEVANVKREKGNLEEQIQRLNSQLQSSQGNQQQPINANQQQAGGNVDTMNAAEKEKLMEHHQQQHQMAPPKMDDKERDPEQHEKVQESTGSPINQAAVEQRKDLEEHPNIKPPEVLDVEEVKYGEHKKDEKTSDSKNVKPKLGDPVLQVAPPNEKVERPGNVEENMNILPPGGDNGKGIQDSKKEQNLQPPRVV